MLGSLWVNLAAQRDMQSVFGAGAMVQRRKEEWKQQRKWQWQRQWEWEWQRQWQWQWQDLAQAAPEDA